MGGIVDSIGGLFGASGDPVGQAQFNPFGVQSALGQARFSDGRANLQLSPELQQSFSGLLRDSQQRLAQSQDLQGTLGFLGRTTQPQFERQQLSQEARLFNQGLLGSTTGQLQQQGLREAQNQALLQNALQAQGQQTQQGIGLLGSALQVGQQPLALGQFGANLGQADLQTQQINLGLQEQAQQRQSDFFGSLVGAGATAAAAFSDIRLKKNIVPIGEGFYAWEWNEEAKRIGADAFPSIGVIAQEIQKYAPDAVFEGDYGYLMVDYSKVI